MGGFSLYSNILIFSHYLTYHYLFLLRWTDYRLHIPGCLTYHYSILLWLTDYRIYINLLLAL